MKRLLAILLILIILIAVPAAPVSATGPSLHKAAGGGTAILPVWDPDDAYWDTYAFTVQQLDEKGNAKGHFVVITAHGTDYHHAKIAADIKYVYFEGNIVYMSGIITEFYHPGYTGRGLMFAAQDNGEGSTASSPDRVSEVLVGVPIDSALKETNRNNFGDPPAHIDLTNGNVQIK